jgi:hypothetical protein
MQIAFLSLDTRTGVQSPAIYRGYGTQFDKTVRVWSGWAGSLVGRWTRKLCWPPISPCIMKRIERVVRLPGLRVIEPMTGSGGQHPSTTST